MCTAGSCNYESCGLESLDKSGLTAVSDRVETGCCVKCGTEEGIVQTRGRNGYCEGCSLTMITHKFRATLGKSKIIRKNDSVLIGYSGKGNALMLVHLIKRGNEEANVHKKLIFRSKLIYVDDGVVKGFTAEERRSACQEIAKQSKSFGVETYAVSLNRSVGDCGGRSVLPIEEYRPGSQDDPEDSKLKGLFDRLKDDTCKDELLRHLRRRVLVSAATELACGKIFFADTSTELAVKVLADLSTGRGGQLGPDLGFCDVRYPDVMILRPMREFTREDVQFYMRHYNLKPVFAGCENNQGWSSIRNISRAFVDGLTTEFGGTVSTIFRTSEKLAGTKPGNSYNGIEDARKEECALCGSKISETSSSLSTVTATRFSRLASSGTAGERNCTEALENVGDDRDENVGNVRKRLCYGCALIFRGSPNWTADEIPDFLSKAVGTEAELELMREQLTDFLL